MRSVGRTYVSRSLIERLCGTRPAATASSISAAGRARRLVITALLAIHATLLAWSSYRDSPTWDEVGHYAAGLSHWDSGQFWLYRVNPPLIRLVACAPAALFGSRVELYANRFESNPQFRAEFYLGQQLVLATGEDFFRLLTVARWTCIPFSLLGAWICFLWARDLFGPNSGMLALILWVFSPNILAHGHLITPDVGATSLGVAAAYLFWRWLNQPSWQRAIGAGLVLGVAELTKTTWIVLFALWPILWLIHVAWQRSEKRVHAWRCGSLQLGIILLLAVWVLNLGYGFEGSFTELGKYRFLSDALAGHSKHLIDMNAVGNRFSDSWLAKVPIPLPYNYVSGIDLQKVDFERHMWSYLRGEWRRGGWWYYYLYALLIKGPIGTWILLGLSVTAVLLFRGYSAPARDELIVLVPLFAVLILVSSQTGFNHHLRYVLPILPFAYIWISKVARSISLHHRVVAVLAGAALVWSVASSLWVYPHSLSYFNEFVGGPKGGHYHLGNSNADWGQDLLYLKEWVKLHPEAIPLQLAYDLPLVDPKIAGVRYRRPPVGPNSSNAAKYKKEELGPLPGWHAISVNRLHGLDKDFEYFLRLEPVGMAGYSIFIYHVGIEEANRLRREYGLPEMSREQYPQGQSGG